MKLFLIRHGETTTSGRSYAGRSDVPLTARGRAQAETLTQSLGQAGVGQILTSPLSRARDSAAPLARHLGLVPQILPALSEIDFGHYEGQDKAALGLNLRKAHADRPIPGGESLADVWARAGLVADLLPRDPGAVCAVVGHFWINRLLWGRLTGLGFAEACASRAYRPKTGSVLTLDLPDRAPSGR